MLFPAGNGRSPRLGDEAGHFASRSRDRCHGPCRAPGIDEGASNEVVGPNISIGFEIEVHLVERGPGLGCAGPKRKHPLVAGHLGADLLCALGMPVVMGLGRWVLINTLLALAKPMLCVKAYGHHVSARSFVKEGVLPLLDAYSSQLAMPEGQPKIMD